MSYLMDTNVVSEFTKSKANPKVVSWLSKIPNESLFLSALSLGEIRKGVENILDVSRKEKLRVWLEHKLPEWFENRILNVDQYVSDRWGRLQVEVKRSIPAIDSLIAATALHYDLSLVTRNTSDFNFPGLHVINPWND